MNTPPASRQPAPRACSPARATAQPQARATIDSTTLLQGGKAVTISHNGEFYRLQATRQGKLILTK